MSNTLDDAVQAAKQGAATGNQPQGSAAVALQSLAPQYDEDQHGTYVARLEEAVKDPKNLNIALTGRYGSGKSSVLDAFEANHERRTLRLAISTLAPEEANDAARTPQSTTTTTNRIQKEVVKQLVYGASQKVGKNSRFSRIAVPSRAKVFTQFALALAFGGGVLFAFGRLPEMRTFNQGQPTWGLYAAWVVLWLVAAAVLTTIRIGLHGQFRVADIKAAGASVSLTEQAPSYFDKYLDELVHYFDLESKDIVILEDLDRFEDPQIFEALRELNILLNDTPRRRRRRRGNVAGRAAARLLDLLPGNLVKKERHRLSMEWGARLLGTGVPLRFVYAVKDSLFEQLGTDTAALAEAGDVATAETLRANRTKFFDVVIPLVPFISHRNARELLSELVNKTGIDGIDRPLLGVVAKHATDMRLLRNICNEYLVFAERLLESDRVAPGLDASKLFALVAYKNFHLEDFELIARRSSALDELYDYKVHIVRDRIAGLQADLRQLLSRPAAGPQDAAAQRLGDALSAVGRAAVSAAGYASARTPLRFTVDDASFEEEQVRECAFWAAVAEHGEVALPLPNGRRVTLTRDALESMFPESADAASWARLNEGAHNERVATIEELIEKFRGADFEDLVRLTPTEPGLEKTTSNAQVAGGDADTSELGTFADRIDATLRSELARDLVKGGFIDQNFTLYAAQFYGDFVGVDVARFMVRNVQPNVMTVDYKFTTPGAVDNLLDEADDDFLHTVAALNIDVVDHLLASGHSGLEHVVARLTENHDDDAQTFLAAFFTSKVHREQLAAEISQKPWNGAFTYLTGNNDISEDVRPHLVSAALAAAEPDFDYAIDSDVRHYIEQNYLGMAVFTEEQSPEVATTVAGLVARAGAVIPVLDAVRALRLRRIFVHESRYKLIADNLRTAISTPGPAGPVNFDRIVNNDDVFEYCLAHPKQYIDVVEGDDATESSVVSPDVLARVLTAVFDLASDTLMQPWRDEDLQRLLELAAPSSALPSLPAVPKPAWPALAKAELFAPTLSNFLNYQEAFAVDDPLAAHLAQAGHIVVADDPAAGDEEVKVGAAVALLNATTLSTRTRVALVESLGLETRVAAESIHPEGNDLFALLLRAGLVDDDEAAFTHFQPGGWASIGPAIEASRGVATFLKPDLVDGMLENLLGHPAASEKLGGVVIKNVDSYLPAVDDIENAAALGNLALLADRRRSSLSPSLLTRIAGARSVDRNVVLRLLARAVPPPAPTDVANVFSLIGAPFDKVASPGATFKVDEEHGDLLSILKADHLVEARKAPLKGWYIVKVLRVS